MRELKRVCFFGGYAPGYPRSELIRKGLEKHGVDVVECRVDPQRKWLSRYILLTRSYLRLPRHFDVIFVPEFRHKDVVLAHFLGRMTGTPVVFDPLVSRYDTKVLDRGDANVGSWQAIHNRNLDRISLGLADLVLADTQTHADFYHEAFGTSQEKMRVLPVGADEELFGPDGASPASADPFVVLFVGNYLPLHGADVIVEAASHLRDRNDIRFVMVGGGQTFEAAAGIAREAGLKNVEFRERVPLAALPEVLGAAHVSLGIFGITPKTRRVVPNKVYQSMAAGRAVLTADSPAMREFFVDGETVFLVAPGDDRALADRILWLRAHPEAVAAVAGAGQALVRKRFSSMEIGGRFIACCHELIND